MAVVKLSSTEDMIKVIKAMIHNNFRLLRVVIWSVIKVNPLCVSIHCHCPEQVKQNLGSISEVINNFVVSMWNESP